MYLDESPGARAGDEAAPHGMKRMESSFILIPDFCIVNFRRPAFVLAARAEDSTRKPAATF
jgi:hypothetical protein